MAKARKEKTDTLLDYNRILSLLRSKQYNRIYLLEGTEPYYIDQLIQYFDEQILAPEEKDFNLITLYGKDSSWSDVANACARFPMFGEHTIVILREATQLRNIDELIPYFRQPAASTILVIDYRGKDSTSKDKWVKAIEDGGGVVFKSQQLTETDIPGWIQQFGAMHQIKIDAEQATTLAAYLGNDLQKITNEIEKVRINEPNLETLSPELIEKYIGISRDYNFLDLPKVIFQNDTVKLSRMLSYFINNPKSAPLPPLVATFYTFADKIYRCYSVPNDFNNPESKSLYYYRGYAAQMDVHTLHKFVAILNELALRAVGIGADSQSSGGILKEAVAKMMLLLHHKQIQ